MLCATDTRALIGYRLHPNTLIPRGRPSDLASLPLGASHPPYAPNNELSPPLELRIASQPALNPSESWNPDNVNVLAGLRRHHVAASPTFQMNYRPGFVGHLSHIFA